MNNYPDSFNPRELETGREPEEQWYSANAVVAVKTRYADDAEQTIKALESDHVTIELYMDFCDEGHSYSTPEHMANEIKYLKAKVQTLKAQIELMEQQA